MKKLKKRLTGLGDESSWERDRNLVMTIGAMFSVKYLGSCEVQKSRGIDVTEEAVLTVRAESKSKRKLLLSVRADRISAVGEETHELVLDQPIEKVSFCSPFPHHTKIFSYIAKDQKHKRWLCYCFQTQRDPGERVCHAFGCAFTACMRKHQQRAAERLKAREEAEQKQKREKENRETRDVAAKGGAPEDLPVVIKREQKADSFAAVLGQLAISKKFSEVDVEECPIPRGRCKDSVGSQFGCERITRPTSSRSRSEGSTRSLEQNRSCSVEGEHADQEEKQHLRIHSDTGTPDILTFPTEIELGVGNSPPSLGGANPEPERASKALEMAIADVELALSFAKANSSNISPDGTAPEGTACQPEANFPSLDCADEGMITARRERAATMSMSNPFASDAALIACSARDDVDDGFVALARERHAK